MNPVPLAFRAASLHVQNLKKVSICVCGSFEANTVSISFSVNTWRLIPSRSLSGLMFSISIPCGLDPMATAIKSSQCDKLYSRGFEPSAIW